MQRQPDPGADVEPAFSEAELGETLKTYFDHLTAGPTPDRLLHLAEALEQALELGQLSRRTPRPS